ncbi:hypothetical protein F0170_23285 [Pseudomonas sp. MAFF 730085]|uniref:Uncharacterized protein n=1 Tax=Pseudomonas kitaguniensis TaxID=2607908 RepID=A0A5N7JZ08_9PSED|nr:hypothetical protein [Pseudomonas kitaguniensis]
MARVQGVHGVEPIVIGVMQVRAMVRGAAGAMKVGQGGLWAMIERICAALGPTASGVPVISAHKKTASGEGSGLFYSATIRTTSAAEPVLSTARAAWSARSSHRRGPCTG